MRMDKIAFGAERLFVHVYWSTWTDSVYFEVYKKKKIN